MSHLLMRQKKGVGFSLLEVVVATVIFLTVLVLLTTLWGTYHSAMSQSRNRLVANGLARSVMEQRMAGGYVNLNLIVGVPQTQSFQSKAQVRGRQLSKNYETTFLAEDFNGANTALRRLSVTVEWEEDSGMKSLSYESCLFKTQ